MRIIPFLLASLITAGLVVVLNTQLVLPAPLGKILSPQHGVWQNAEATNSDYSANIQLPGLKGKVTVYLDDRLVPHVFAEQENDAYFVQGYLHAKFRLWQMELQTHAAAGRASEIIGEKALDHDREFRRLGMVYAAEISLEEVEKDAGIKAECDAYTAGVNAYISQLTESELPIEYKLIGYMPEPWSNLKTALFLKYMSYDLASHDEDFELTNARAYFSAEDFAILFPMIQDSLDPIIPKGTVFEKPAFLPVAPADADSGYFRSAVVAAQETQKPDRSNGSNNWAVSGKKTSSGYPILANDPHLGLNLPSLWYEIQLSTPDFNAYGVSFPGAPGVIIGYNDSCAFGFTNGGRDVRDYYEVKFKDEKRNEYMFNGQWEPTRWRIDTIAIRNKAPFIDSVAYVKLGEDWCPVMFDPGFSGGKGKLKKNYAVRWKAHDRSSELRIFHQLNHARNYSDYSAAVVNLHTPGQNAVFATKSGDIALRTQGEWPAKWKGQGDYVMPGTDTAYLWKAMIPQQEVPFQYNPERGFVSSANQKPVDDQTYPYYLGRHYPLYRGIYINRKLNAMTGITPQMMMDLQNDPHDLFAEMAMPLLKKYIRAGDLNDSGRKYFEILSAWDQDNDPDSKGATIFNVYWKILEKAIFDDEFARAPTPIKWPEESSILEGLLKDSSYKFVDNITTGPVETMQDIFTAAFAKAAVELGPIEAEGKLEWVKFKHTGINHLARQALAPFSRPNLNTGGGARSVNATKSDHGPSWRMVISLTPETEAYGVYPGGQSGNPGSRFYDNFVDQWAAGKYYSLWMMKATEQKDPRVKWTMSFHP